MKTIFDGKEEASIKLKHIVIFLEQKYVIHPQVVIPLVPAPQ